MSKYYYSTLIALLFLCFHPFNEITAHVVENYSTCQDLDLGNTDPELVVVGGTFCMDGDFEVSVNVLNFNAITSFQFGLLWDPAVLEFKELVEVNSTFQGVQDTVMDEEGRYNIIWVDPFLLGKDVNNGNPLVRISFTPKGSNGSVSNLTFDTLSVPVEISQNVNGSATIVSYKVTTGNAFISAPELMNVQITDQTGQQSNGAVDITVEKGTLPYTYKWSDGSTDEDLDQVGSGTYSCTVTDSRDCEIIIGPFEVQGLTSLNEIATLTSLDVFPNPVSQQLTVRAGFEENTRLQLQLYDVLGKAVIREEHQTQYIDRQLNVAHLSKGTYFLRLITDDGQVSRRIIVTD